MTLEEITILAKNTISQMNAEQSAFFMESFKDGNLEAAAQVLKDVSAEADRKAAKIRAALRNDPRKMQEMKGLVYDMIVYDMAAA
jgi:hypothetical protein